VVKGGLADKQAYRDVVSETSSEAANKGKRVPFVEGKGEDKELLVCYHTNNSRTIHGRNRTSYRNFERFFLMRK